MSQDLLQHGTVVQYLLIVWMQNTSVGNAECWRTKFKATVDIVCAYTTG